MRARLRLPLVGLAIVLIAGTVSVSAALSDLRLVQYASGFSSPLGFVQDPAHPEVQFVVEQGGRIRVLVAGQLQQTDFLNLAGQIVSGGEQGLLGLAFPPDAGTSGRFYVNFTDPSGNTVVARFKRTANPLVANPATRFDLQWSDGQRIIPQPFSNHNGGCMAFGPDGYLYIGMGDGGSGDDPGNNAQTPSTLLGKILRIDVSVPEADLKGFRIPPDNPFVGSSLPGVRPEIWDFGMRNPWRFSFDDVVHGGTGALVIGDVGQGQWEEVDYEPRGRGGRNYGWRIREGANAHIAGTPAFVPLIDPIHQYDHTVGLCIIGGFVYRGSAIPSIRGRYFFADISRLRVWSLLITPDATGEGIPSDLVEHTATIGAGTGLGSISSFGVDAAGELYATDYGRGLVLKLVSSPPFSPTNFRVVR
jgi:glucose/arabinose dehydrogenase